jgi:hypothetical protein
MLDGMDKAAALQRPCFDRVANENQAIVFP